MTATADPRRRAAALDFDLPAAEWLPRLSVAATFLYHGITKFPNLEGMAGYLGLPVALFTLVAIVEVGAGLALIAGGALRSALGDILTRLGGAGVAVIMVGAIALVHWGQWSNGPTEAHPAGGMEFQTLLLALGLMWLARGNRALHGRP